MAQIYKQQLTEIFAGTRTEEQIDEVINIILGEQDETLQHDECLEEMINLLVTSGDSALENHNEEPEGAAGVTINKPQIQQYDQYLDRIQNMFPGISRTYLVEFCQQYVPFNFDQVVEDLTNTDYNRTERDPLDIWQHLKEMLPNADPTYLRNQARVLVNRPEGELEEFIQNAIENNEYPTMKQYLINQELAADFKFYITNFTVRQYLKRVPNPLEKFQGANKKPTFSEDAIESDVQFAMTFLYNQFTYLRKKEINKVFLHFKRDLVKTVNRLKSFPKAFRHPRNALQLNECKNVDLLQEISFLKNERLINQILKQKDDKYKTALEDARAHGLLQTCQCCFDDELIPEVCYFCNKSCTFCKECVKAGAENVIGREETRFPCFADCDSEFAYSTLQMVLDSKTFQGVWQRKQIEEIRNANIDGLEKCLFCDFCMIPDEGDKIFKCRNINCMAETCRLCRHKAHVPFRCNEIEYDEDVKIRTFIENKMTEALLIKCWKCSKQYYKETGCNKMTCICGAKMCYVCKKAVDDYSHFGNNRCPLYTENLHQFHLNNVMQGARLAKDELGITTNPDKLKFDPTRGLENDVA